MRLAGLVPAVRSLEHCQVSNGAMYPGKPGNRSPYTIPFMFHQKQPAACRAATASRFHARHQPGCMRCRRCWPAPPGWHPCRPPPYPPGLPAEGQRSQHSIPALPASCTRERERCMHACSHAGGTCAHLPAGGHAARRGGLEERRVVLQAPGDGAAHLRAGGRRVCITCYHASDGATRMRGEPQAGGTGRSLQAQPDRTACCWARMHASSAKE